MLDLARVLRRRRTPRVIGIDDAPFPRRKGARVDLCGVVCSATRMEGMVWGHARRDGWNATDAVVRALDGSKFLPQVHAILLDGIAFGGFNIVDLPQLAERLDRPCVAVMRRPPDMPAVHRALERLTRPEKRKALLVRAGTIHERHPFTFQVCGAEPDDIEKLLHAVTDHGHVPEALRLAHLIGAAVKMGQSGKRA